jgi:hypothetical protein
MSKMDGATTYNFEDIAHLCVKCFQNIYKEENQVSISKGLKVSSFFLSFINEDDNKILLKRLQRMNFSC